LAFSDILLPQRAASAARGALAARPLNAEVGPLIRLSATIKQLLDRNPNVARDLPQQCW
jgi:hypothetical protein